MKVAKYRNVNQQDLSVTRDILFYDIPAESKIEETYDLIGSLRKIHALQVKKQYKHQAVKVKMQLNKQYENKFLNDKWQIEIGFLKKRLVRWFQEV